MGNAFFLPEPDEARWKIECDFGIPSYLYHYKQGLDTTKYVFCSPVYDLVYKRPSNNL